MILLRRESLKSDNAEEAHDESDNGIATQAFHNDATTDTLMLLLRRESLKSDNFDESDKGTAAQAVHNDANTNITNDTTEEGVTKVRQL